MTMITNPRLCPWQESRGHFRDRHLLHREPEQPEIEHDREDDEQRQRQDVRRLDQRIQIERLMERNAPGRARQPFDERRSDIRAEPRP